jgi:hypothetical protein
MSTGPLKVRLLRNALLSEDIVTSPSPSLEPQSLEQAAKVVKWDIRVCRPTHNLFQQSRPLTHTFTVSHSRSCGNCPIRRHTCPSRLSIPNPAGPSPAGRIGALFGDSPSTGSEKRRLLRPKGRGRRHFFDADADADSDFDFDLEEGRVVRRGAGGAEPPPRLLGAARRRSDRGWRRDVGVTERATIGWRGGEGGRGRWRRRS